MNLRASRGLTLTLAGIAALMLLLVVLFWVGVGRGYSWWPLDPLDSAAGKKKLANAQYRLGAWDNFADVNTRPLFNEDRRPTPPMPPDAPVDAKPIPKLELVLAGVILTSKTRLAMVKEKGKEKSMTVKEGGALPGELAAWTLAEVKPRSAVFKNSVGESATVELIPVASSQKPTPPPPPRTPTPPVPGAPPPQPGQAPPMRRRQRICSSVSMRGVSRYASSNSSNRRRHQPRRLSPRSSSGSLKMNSERGTKLCR